MTQLCVIYAAKSTEDKHGSIPTQLEDCRSMAEREGLTAVAEYKDEAKSAYSESRGEALAQAKEHAEKIAPCSLIVQHTDRLARGDAVQAAHLVEVVLWARKAGVTIRSVQDDSTCENLVMAVVMGERNYEDSRRKSEAVKSGKRRRAAGGKYAGGDEPYGLSYQRIDDERTLVPNPAEVPIVLRMYGEYAKGSSDLGIAKRLSADAIPTPGERARWHPSTIRRILTNPIYVGELEVDGERVPSNVAPIVPRELWDSCQARRKALATTKGNGRGRPPSGAFLFTGGSLRCRCGSAMVPRSDADVYRCSGRSHNGSEFCDQAQIPRRLVDESVYSYFAREFDFEATQTALSREAERKLSEAQALQEQAASEAQKARERLSRVQRDYQDGAIPRDDWNEQREQLTAELQAAEAELERLTKRVDAEREALATFSAEDALTEHLARIRAVVSGSVKDAQTIEEARAAIQTLFVSFKLAPSRLNPSKPGAIRRGLGAKANVNIILPELRQGIVCLPRNPDELWEKWLTEDSSEPDNSACSKVRAHADHRGGVDRL